MLDAAAGIRREKLKKLFEISRHNAISSELLQDSASYIQKNDDASQKKNDIFLSVSRNPFAYWFMVYPEDKMNNNSELLTPRR